MKPSVHARLVNWGRFQREGMVAANIPPQNTKGSWPKFRTSEQWLDLDAPDPIDDDEAIETQKAMVRCAANDMEAAMILTKRYRDGWDIDERVYERAINKFGKYL